MKLISGIDWVLLEIKMDETPSLNYVTFSVSGVFLFCLKTFK
jgi:hypothetical protein